MLAHTPTFETLAIAPVKQSDVIVVRQSGTLGNYTDDLTMKWSSGTILMSANIDAVGEMFGVATKKATVKLLGIVSGIVAKDLFQVRLGLYNSATTSYDYVSQGFFLVDTVDYDYEAGSTTVNLYDHMWTASRTMYTDVVISADLEYPATVEDFAGLMAEKLGITLMAGFDLLPNAKYEITEDLYTAISGSTLQSAIQDIAGATGTTARITDTSLIFLQYFPSTENLSSSSLKTLKIGNTYGPITSLVLGRVPQNDNVALYSSSLAAQTIESVNATTNLMTLTPHRLADGQMVQFSSTGTLPAPLLANTSYYVYTNGNLNTFALAPTYSDATQAQTALSFNGSTSNVTVPHSESLNIGNNDNYYISLWFKTTTLSDQSISEKWYDDGPSVINRYPWAIRGPVTGSGNVSFNIYDGVNNPGVGSGTNLADGKWHHIVAVRDHTGDRLHMYVDGVFKASSIDTTNGNVSSDRVTVIGARTPTSYRFNGQIDKFQVFTGLPTADDVSRLYNGRAPINGELRMGLNINEGSGTTLADSSGNGNTGTVSNGTWVDNRTLIDLTTTGTGTLTLKPLSTKEIQINNNQILDDDRASLIVPLYDKLSGIYWSEVKADTVGLGWHEVGDVIQFTQGTTTVRAFLNEVHLVLAGSIKESLLSKIPDGSANINYQTAGGILKSLQNAEIKVDKQANEIISIVSEQEVVNNQLQEDFTQIQQTVDNINFNIQNAGGNNLVINSVGYATDRAEDDAAVFYDKLYAWDYVGLDGITTADYTIATHGTVTSSDSSTSQNLGGAAGRAIRFDSSHATGKGIRLTQRVAVAVGAPLSFGVRVLNVPGNGSATITLSNTNESRQIVIASTDNYPWTELTIEDFTTTLPWLDVIIEAKAAGFELTDLRLMYGVTIQKWTQADTELMSTNIQFTEDGIRVYNPALDMETRITNSDFQTVRRSDGVILFEADNTGVRANDFTIRGSSDYYTDGKSVIKQITIPLDDPKGGIAFLKGTE